MRDFLQCKENLAYLLLFDNSYITRLTKATCLRNNVILSEKSICYCFKTSCCNLLCILCFMFLICFFPSLICIQEKFEVNF